MNLSEPASESWLVKVAPLPCFSVHSIPGVHAVCENLVSTLFIQCKLEILMRFSRVAFFFSEYWIYDIVIYSVAFYT